MKKTFERQQHDFYSVWSQINILYCKWAELLHINYTTLLTLYGLDVHGGMTQKNICDFYGFPKQTVNGAVHNLLRCGYVTFEASPKDKREKLVKLTENGKAYAEELLEPLYQAEQYAFSAIGDEKMTQLLDTIDIYNTLLEKRLEEMK